jgi:carbamoyl-phosphate synthase small subunit
VSDAILVLEDGTTFRGEAFGAVGETFGEAVFTTGMTGYQETLTDPSYHRQVVVQTAPHIGNTGVNHEDDESRRIWVAGYVVRDPSPHRSNWRATGNLEDRLRQEGVVGIGGVDTRALTRHLRERGAMRVGVSSVDTDAGALLQRVLASPEMVGANLSDQVSTPRPYVIGPDGEHRYTVAALDLGIKHNVARRLAARGVRTHVLPASSTLDELLATGPDAVFLSPGPGDPATADHAVTLAREVLGRRIPLFGICFGSQILGRALGFDTYKLVYGHRGLNQPVLDRTTGKVEITTHNHGFAVAAPLDGRLETEFGPAEVSHVCLNDDVVEGLRCFDVPAFTVQYHPEAAAGTHDADYLFDRFAELIEGAPAHA